MPELWCPRLQEAALAFCQEHALDKGIAGPLARHIQGNLDRARQDALAQVSPYCRPFASQTTVLPEANSMWQPVYPQSIMPGMHNAHVVHHTWHTQDVQCLACMITAAQLWQSAHDHSVVCAVASRVKAWLRDELRIN